MRVISRKRIVDYIIKNTQAAIPLNFWYYKILKVKANNHHDLTKTFASADVIGKYTIFDIGGNNYRLITSIHYNNQRVYVREIWTHAQYSKPSNQRKLEEGEL